MHGYWFENQVLCNLKKKVKSNVCWAGFFFCIIYMFIFKTALSDTRSKWKRVFQIILLNMYMVILFGFWLCSKGNNSKHSKALIECRYYIPVKCSLILFTFHNSFPSLPYIGPWSLMELPCSCWDSKWVLYSWILLHPNEHSEHLYIYSESDFACSW